MGSEFVKVELQDRILHVLVDREEKRNALSLAVLGEIRETFTNHAANQEIVAAVVMGAGKRCFAAGGDLQELDTVRDEVRLRAMTDAAFAALNSIRHFPVPVIAALNGDALGGGAEFALSCDMRVFARHARIAFVQGNLCVSSAWGGGIDLMRLLGDANALRLLTRVEFIDAEEAWRLGLAQAVASEDESIEAALERFLAPIKQMRPHVMRAFKALGRAYRDGARPQELREVEVTSLMETWLHDDHWQAAAKIQARIADKGRSE